MRRLPAEALPNPLELPERLDRGVNPDDPRPKDRPRLPELNPCERVRPKDRVDPERPKDGRERPKDGRVRPTDGRERPIEGRDRPPNERERPTEGREPPRERLNPPDRLIPPERPTLLERPTLPRWAVAMSPRTSMAPRRRHVRVMIGCFMVDPPKTGCPAASLRGQRMGADSGIGNAPSLAGPEPRGCSGSSAHHCHYNPSAVFQQSRDSRTPAFRGNLQALPPSDLTYDTAHERTSMAPGHPHRQQQRRRATSARRAGFCLMWILCTANAVQAQNRTWDIGRWEDAWRSAASSPTRRTLLIHAAQRVGTKGSLGFLRSLLRRWPRDDDAWDALEAIIYHPLADAKSTILTLYEKTPGIAEKVDLIDLLIRESKARTESLALLEEQIRRHLGDPLGSALLRLLTLFLDEDDPLRAKATTFLTDLYGESENPVVQGDIWRVARHLPADDRMPFWVAAVEDQDRLHAGEAALELLRRGTPGAEDLVVDAWIVDLARAEASGMRRVLSASGRPSLVVKLAKRIEDVPWADVRRLFDIMQASEIEKLNPFFFSLLSDPEPKAKALAVLFFRSHPRADLVKHLERLARDESLVTATWAALTLADSTGRQRPWERVRGRIRSGGFDLHWTKLRRLADAGVAGATARMWLTESLERHKDWRLLTALLPLAGTASLDDFGRRMEPFLAHRRWQVRLAAIEALIKDGRRQVLPQLARATGFDHYRLARVAADGLAYLTGKRFGVAPKVWAAWIETLPQNWVPLRLPPALHARAANERYGPMFYGLDLRSNRIVFVCDISGSMNGGKLETLKVELRRAISSLSPPGSYNVLLFSGGVTSFFGGIRPATPSRKKGTIERLRDVRADGGTNLWGGIERAFKDKEADTIVVLTDGQPSAGRITQTSEILKAVRERNRYRRLQIHSLFVSSLGIDGVDPSADFMRRLADQNEGQFKLAAP